MLSIGKLVAGAEDYYLRSLAAGLEEYYLGAGEAPGRWLGAACAELGLAAEVEAEALRALLAGRSPSDGEQLLPALRAERVAGFDLTLSAPKSVSVLYGLCSDQLSEAVRRVHDAAVSEALSYLEAHAALARRGHNGTERIGTSGLVAAGFRHRTSRAGDPQLHTHVLVANVVKGSDGRWSSLFGARIYQHAKTAGFVYQASLRAGLSVGLGLSFDEVRNGTAELSGVPKRLLHEFSTRRAQVLARLDEVGESSAAAAELAALATRCRKPAPPDGGAPGLPGLRETWQARAGAAGVDLGDLERLVGRAQRLEPESASLEAVFERLLGPAGLTEKSSTFERRDAVRALAEALASGASLARLEALADELVSSPEVVALGREGRGGEELLTTRELLGLERLLVSLAGEVRGTGRCVAAEATIAEVLSERPTISAEQRAMVHRLCSSGSGVEVVVGRAGTGKTFALDAARAAWQREGFRVRGTALSARAAAELSDGAGIASGTLARLLVELERGEVILGPRDVVVLDEAGMVGTRELARLAGEVTRPGGKLVLVGDPRQLPEIEAGGALAALARRPGTVVLTENRRQEAAWEREALDELRHGDLETAVALLLGEGPRPPGGLGRLGSRRDGEGLGGVAGLLSSGAHVRPPPFRRRRAERPRPRRAALPRAPWDRRRPRRGPGLRDRRRGDVPSKRPPPRRKERRARARRRPRERRRPRRRDGERPSPPAALLPRGRAPRPRVRDDGPQGAGGDGRPRLRPRRRQPLSGGGLRRHEPGGRAKRPLPRHLGLRRGLRRGSLLGRAPPRRRPLPLGGKAPRPRHARARRRLGRGPGAARGRRLPSRGRSPMQGEPLAAGERGRSSGRAEDERPRESRGDVSAAQGGALYECGRGHASAAPRSRPCAGPRRRLLRAGERLDSQARAKPLAGEGALRLVDTVTTRRWSGLHTGWAAREPQGRSEVFAGLEQSVLVLGPPRCGKTSAIVVPSVLAAPGAVVSTSTKPDVLEVTGRWRAEWGRCFVFDPSGTTGMPEHAVPLRWSPVQGAGSWETAVSTAHSLASAARPGASLSEAAHWVERAEALIAPLLHAAALAERSLADVMGWVLAHELRQPARILEARAGEMARVVLAGIAGTEERERSGILSTAAGLLGAYRSEAALKAACEPNFDPVAFSYSPDTVYVTAPGHAQDQLAPLVVTLLEQIRRAAYARPPDACPVVFALDEVAQIAPLPSLPQLAAEGGGQGVVTLACLQDLSQARVRWGEAADGFFSLFSAKLVFPGIGDRLTLELVSAMAGEAEVPTRSVTRIPLLQALLTGRFDLHETRSVIWRPRLPLDEAAMGRPGCALHLRPEEGLSYVAVCPWWEVASLRRAVTGESFDADPTAAEPERRRDDPRGSRWDE